MNKEQKEALQAQLDEEKELIRQLKLAFGQAQDDCVNRIIDLSRRKDMENIQTIIYQKQYQQVLKDQLDSILDNLHGNEYKKVSDYLTKCYDNGFIGAMYDIAGQGIPLIIPIDQEQVVKAIKLDTKLSKPLYKSLGEDINSIKKNVRSEVSRGIANGSSWNEVAANLARKFKNTPFSKAYNNAIRIARTEGHRIQNQAALDAQEKAKSKGADVVKQWDATLDGKTRDSHRKLDGQIREVDEPFEVDGMKADAPGMFGDPAEDCNCRCALLQRARWALDESELETLRERASFHGLLVDDSKEFGHEKAKDFSKFKKKYLKASYEESEKEAFKRRYGITEKDEKAIYDYMSFKSYVVNEKLRNGNQLTNEEKQFINNLNEALNKLPSFNGNLQRSLYFDDQESLNNFLSEYEINMPVSYKSFISTTKGETYNHEGQVQIYIQDSKNGKDMSIFNRKEQEVLYKTDSEFNVIYMTEHDGVHYILLGENNE